MTPSRLVIRAPNWLGDAVMALPALAAVRAAMPETRIAIAAIANAEIHAAETKTLRSAGLRPVVFG